jgi:thioredoxin-like negative regulator of GroEL
LKLSAIELVQFQMFMDENFEWAKKIKELPILFMQGNEDKLVKPDGTWELFNALDCSNKMFLSVPSEHLIFEELKVEDDNLRDKYVLLVEAWIDSCIGEKDDTQAASRYQQSLTRALELLVKEDFLKAEGQLREYLNSNPDSAEGHFWLGVCLVKQGRLESAKSAFLLSRDLGEGSEASLKANEYLLDLHKSIQSRDGGNKPKQDPQKVNSQIQEMLSGKPGVLVFGTKWCQQCIQAEEKLKDLTNAIPDKLVIKVIDLDDDNNDCLVNSSGIGPIPTLVFVAADGCEVGRHIGLPDQVNLARLLDEIVK